MEEFLRQNQSMFYRYALRITDNENDAEDIVQELAIKMWEFKNEFENIENKVAWCMTVTRNLALDKIRSIKRKKTDILENANYKTSYDGVNPDKELENKDLLEKVRKIINSMPENYKSLIQLREIEGLSYKEISEIMNTEVQNIKVQLFRARKLLEQLISESKLTYK